MNSHRFIRALIGALVIVAAISAVSCDERNTADIPPVVYSLKQNILTNGSAQYVDLQDYLLGVAAASSGTYVYDISQLDSPVELFHRELAEPLYATGVAVDLVNRIVFTSADGSSIGDRFPLDFIDTGERIGSALVDGPIVDMEFVSTTERFNLWTVDNSSGDGLSVSSYCYDTDLMDFLPNCIQDRFGYEHFSSRMRGMGRKGELFALALNDYRVRLHDSNDAASLSEVETPGDPYDCAWVGDFVLVADNFFITIINAANIDSPMVVSTYVIPGADRLQKIVVDGNFAVLLDDSDGLYIVDVTDPMKPELVQSISLPEPTCVSAYNGTMVASDEQLGVLIYQR